MSPTILVVDDERDITSFVAELLTDEGYVVRVVNDGASALDAIRADPPALVLLDVAMPGMSGTTVLRELRASEFASLPVIMATAGLHTQALVDEGATDVLAKPFAIEQLLEAIERYAERS
jgi:DNA-binding response OmpR family regulator